MKRRDFLKRAGMLAVAMPVLGSLPAPAEAAANWTPPEPRRIEPVYWLVENPTNKRLIFANWQHAIMLDPGDWAIVPSLPDAGFEFEYDLGLEVTRISRITAAACVDLHAAQAKAFRAGAIPGSL